MQDRIAIEEVRYQYAHALDTQDWTALLSLFTDQVDMDFSDFGIPRQTVTRDEFIASFQHNLSRPGLKTQHIFSSFRIRVDGDRAQSISNFVGHHFLAGFASGEEFTLRGIYTDTLQKTVDGWQITGTACQLLYMTGNPELLASS